VIASGKHLARDQPVHQARMLRSIGNVRRRNQAFAERLDREAAPSASATVMISTGPPPSPPALSGKGKRRYAELGQLAPVRPVEPAGCLALPPRFSRSSPCTSAQKRSTSAFSMAWVSVRSKFTQRAPAAAP
jgi:hypothetical protein